MLALGLGLVCGGFDRRLGDYALAVDVEECESCCRPGDKGWTKLAMFFSDTED